MTIQPGTQIGTFRVTAPLGVGAIGDVYLSRDTERDREVTIELLPNTLASDSDQYVRFTRQMDRFIAVKHPKLATVYGTEIANDMAFLVMESVEGESLDNRAAEAPLAVEDVVDVFAQVAAGLDAAHDAGVVHGHLHPRDIVIAPEGKVKLLNLGVVSAWKAATDTEGDTDVTAYTSPEQARGDSFDKRADIWAFGGCLFHALSGKQPFSAPDVKEAILDHDPDWSALPADVPDDLHNLLRRCLEQDPNRRLRDMGDIRIRLEDLAERIGGNTSDDATAYATDDAPKGFRAVVGPLVSGGVGLALAVVVILIMATLGRRTESDSARTINETRGPIRSLAVVPLKTPGTSEEHVAFAEELTRAIIHELQQSMSGRVLAYETMKPYGGADMPASEVATDLGADGIIEGSVFRNGNKVRINVQLIHGPSDTHLWAERFEGTTDELVHLQRRVARAIGNRIDATGTR